MSNLVRVFVFSLCLLFRIGLAQADLMDELLAREREFNQKNICQITGMTLAQYEKDCTEIKDAFEKHGLGSEWVQCEELAFGEQKYGVVRLLTDRIINQYVLGKKVSDCYRGRRSTALKREPEVENLLEIADKYFKDFPLTEKKKLSLSFSSDTPLATIWDQLMSSFKDVVLGELHHDVTPKRALIEHLELLKKHHFAIALEHVLYEPYQQLLDDYMKGGSEELPPRLKVYLEALDEGQMVGFQTPETFRKKYSYTELVRAARMAGVRIIVFETETSYSIGTQGNHSRKDRYQAMNFLAKLITDRERHDHKIVHFVGSAHTNTREGVPGVAELMGNAPSLVIADSKLDHRKIEFQVDKGDQDIKADIYILEPVRLRK